ncbi:imidazolonepropionase [Frateuria aurantia]
MVSPVIWKHMHLYPGGAMSACIEQAAMVIEHGRIAWVGAACELPARYADLACEDLGGRWVTPGLVDCHTHLVHGGDRAGEFGQRLAGVSYETIARQGGGILSTVRASRATDEAGLFRQAADRLEAMLAQGVTTLEIKSGYGLELEAERKLLRVARRLGTIYPVTVYTTFLGAHALPPEFHGRADAYIDEVCQRMLPALVDEGLVDAVDVFCERIGFDLAQTERVFEAAQRHGLPVKIHAEQLSNSGGTRLAAQYRALSADHLEYLDEDGVVAMHAAGMVAVLLPGAYYFIRETQPPPLAWLRKHSVPMALASDCNPGTSPLTSLPQVMNMAATLFGMTVPEILQAVTVNAARALGQGDRHGHLAAGREADFAVWSVADLAELPYWMGRPLCQRVVRGGRTVFHRHDR